MSAPTTDNLPEIDVERLRAWLEGRRQEMVDDLAAYVSTETPSTDKRCLDAGLAWVRGWLDGSLGAPAAARTVEGGERGDILVADYPGVGDRPVALLCHYDTVWDEGTLADWPFTVDGDRATGPGVFDMKAGLVQAVWGLRALDAAGLARPPVRLVLNGDEEIGSPASRPVIEDASAAASAVLVFEASAGGAIKTARKGVGIYRVTTRGVEAHAGLDPTKGASAIEEIARVTLRLHALTDLEAGTTVNVGLLGGGTRTNVIAGEAVADIDVRARTAPEADRVERFIETLGTHDPRVTLTVEGGWNRPVMERTEPITRMYEVARALAARMDVDLREAVVGGASDGNFAAAMGLPVLDGFGAVGDGAHARHEHVSLDGMVERSALAAAVLHALG
ncbi:MAG: M20 family metallopeptidase [Streptosporangiaceae bacterium]